MTPGSTGWYDDIMKPFEHTEDTTWSGFVAGIGYCRIDNDPTWGVWAYTEHGDSYGPFDTEAAAEDVLFDLAYSEV